MITARSGGTTPEQNRRRNGRAGTGHKTHPRFVCRMHGTKEGAAKGCVFLVGAGPGDAGLITVRGRRLLEQADVIVHDRLICGDVLTCARTNAEIMDVRKVCGHGASAQEKINAILIDRAGRGQSVVRLKGGDPFVFGRGWEEWCACRGAGVSCVVVPGVTSALSVPSCIGIPTTNRGTGRAFAVVAAQGCTPHGASGLDFCALARIPTLIILMGRSNLGDIARSLIEAGRNPDTPAACIERGTTARQRSVVTTLATIAEAADRAGLRAPVVTVIGEVAACAHGYDTQSMPICGCSHIDGPLADKRIVVTRSTSSSRGLCRRLTSAGAIPIEAPMLRVDYRPDRTELESLARRLDRYEWITFVSVHAVRGFFSAMAEFGQDARALAPCKVAAVGPITAAALRNRGVVADQVATPYSASALVEALHRDAPDRSCRVLLPHGNARFHSLAHHLRRRGLLVEPIKVYDTVPLTPSEPVRSVIRSGVDAILFCSPAAARRFAALRLDTAGAVIACMGPSTASAASGAGLTVDVIAKEHTDAGLVRALGEHLELSGSPVGVDNTVPHLGSPT